MKSRLTALVGGLALGSALLFTSAGIVTAATPATGPSGKGACATEAAAVKTGATVATLRTFGDCEINRRFVTLTNLTAKITASKVMTSSDKAALQGEIGLTTCSRKFVKSSS